MPILIAWRLGWRNSRSVTAGALRRTGYAVISVQIDTLAGLILGLSLASTGILTGIPITTVPTRLMPAVAVGIAIITSLGNPGGFVAPVLIGKISISMSSMAGGFWIIGGLPLFQATQVVLSLRAQR